MNTQEIVSKLWNLCNVLRDDGITYHQYVTELTYLLFLKMSQETGTENQLPAGYRWDDLVHLHGIPLKEAYDRLLLELGQNGSGRIKQIYANAASNIKEPRNLEKLIKSIDQLDWYSAKVEGLGDLYEGLLKKNADEKKSGAGQYFTPRTLINIMVELLDPQPGERCNDPACGTFGFMIAADHYIRSKTDNYYDLSEAQAAFQRHEAFTGCELVQDAHRLALMNASLHDIQGQIVLGDSLSEDGKRMHGYDVVLANPPFGTKKGGERPTRDDFTYPTSNKQLNFMQHIYRSLKPGGRAAVVLPDNVLFQDGDGQKIRADLMDKCNLHTILRLPTGIFYAQGVKTNVLFFTRGQHDKGNTQEVWFYDLRTNMPSFGVRNPLKESHFADFVAAYSAPDRAAVQDERWSCLSREAIAQKGNSLDLGLMADASLLGHDDLPDPIAATEEAIGKLEVAADLLAQVKRELELLGVGRSV
ncbi:MAG: N-6 DNA methylase [Candidatus Sericytochromatia bacterium]